MAGIDNLTPYEKGVSGNPKGKIAGTKNRSTVLKELYAMVIQGKDFSGAEKSMPVETAMMTSLIMQGLKGDVMAIREAQDTVYGKIVDKSETNMTVNTMGKVKDADGKELKFDIGSEPDGVRQVEEEE